MEDLIKKSSEEVNKLSKKLVDMDILLSFNTISEYLGEEGKELIKDNEINYKLYIFPVEYEEFLYEALGVQDNFLNEPDFNKYKELIELEDIEYKDKWNDLYSIADDDLFMELNSIFKKMDEDYEYIEYLETWIVSDRLYNELKNNGEMVSNLDDIKIWYRATSNSAIYNDEIIKQLSIKLIG